MTTQIDFWELFAGLILFLFAMSQLESALKSLGGRSLARFLEQQSENRFSAVMGGLVGTALLQSSSVVALMVLAFVGAGLARALMFEIRYTSGLKMAFKIGLIARACHAY